MYLHQVSGGRSWWTPCTYIKYLEVVVGERDVAVSPGGGPSDRLLHVMFYVQRELLHTQLLLEIDKLVYIYYIKVKSAYKEPAYNELPVIRNWFLFPNLYQGTSLLYIYKELRL